MKGEEEEVMNEIVRQNPCKNMKKRKEKKEHFAWITWLHEQAFPGTLQGISHVAASCLHRTWRWTSQLSHLLPKGAAALLWNTLFLWTLWHLVLPSCLCLAPGAWPEPRRARWRARRRIRADGGGVGFGSHEVQRSVWLRLVSHGEDGAVAGVTGKGMKKGCWAVSWCFWWV